MIVTAVWLRGNRQLCINITAGYATQHATKLLLEREVAYIRYLNRYGPNFEHMHWSMRDNEIFGPDRPTL